MIHAGLWLAAFLFLLFLGFFALALLCGLFYELATWLVLRFRRTRSLVLP
jgi:hypothetical protein